MSLLATRAVWENSAAREMSRLVMLSLADHSNDDGLTWPSVETIAKECLLTTRGVQKILRRLVEIGEIEIERAGGGRALTTRYRITVNVCSLLSKLYPERGGLNPEQAGSPEPLTSEEGHGAGAPTNVFLSKFSSPSREVISLWDSIVVSARIGFEKVTAYSSGLNQVAETAAAIYPNELAGMFRRLAKRESESPTIGRSRTLTRVLHDIMDQAGFYDRCCDPLTLQEFVGRDRIFCRVPKKKKKNAFGESSVAGRRLGKED